MRRILGACCAMAFFCAGCHRPPTGPASETPAPRPGKLRVLATIAPMYCFAKNVAGDLADVEMIVPDGINPRNFQPSREDVKKIMRADVVVENGFGFEEWMDRLETQGLKQGAVRVIAARGTGPGIPGLPGDPNTPPADAPQGLPSQSPDPHVWLDPLMAIKEVQNIRDALMARDPAHADDYLANENQYEATLRDLDEEVGRVTVDIAKRRVYCVDRTFLYFLSRYQFTPAGPPSPDQAGHVPDQAEADAVLTATGAGGQAWAGTKLPVVIGFPMETGPASVDLYEKGTLANAKALREGLMR